MLSMVKTIYKNHDFDQKITNFKMFTIFKKKLYIYVDLVVLNEQLQYFVVDSPSLLIILSLEFPPPPKKK